MRRTPLLLACLVLAAGLASVPRHLASRVSTGNDFVHFESAQVHPLAITPDGGRLLVVNTPDARLAVFDLAGALPARIAEIPVGLEPVSVAVRDGEAWVVNALSDDVSIVDLQTLHVRATLRVGDEPGDVVFAGTPERAYVSVSQEDVVKVFDPVTLAQVASIATACRMPQVLARNGDGSRVYAAGLHAGNSTSVLSEAEAGDSLPPPNPPKSPSLPPAPRVGLIIQQLANGNWVDETGRLWSAKARYSVHDADVTEIDAATNTVVRAVGGIATTSFGLAVSAANGTVAVIGTEARNLTRFEPNLRGHAVDTRLGLVTSGGGVTLRDLNPHIDYSVTPGPAAETDSAIGIPTGVAWSADGQRLYVTSLASNRLGVLDPAAPGVLARRPTVAGPTGVVVDDARGRIYVLGRFHNQLQTFSTSALASLAVTPIGFDPTPDAIVNGRKFFYGGFTSGHGEQACASCHLFGDFDNIAWDLGDPQGTMQPIDRTGMVDPFIDSSVHPMKGPMATQTLRGLPNTGMLHWRADRRTLSSFNGAFVGLMGRAVQLPDSQMAAFNDFVLPLVHPPNPRQLLDRSFAGAPLHQPSAQRGAQFFLNQPTDGGLTCNQCHTATNFGPGTNGQIINNVALQESQDMKVPQLRNMYRKTGFTDLPGAQNKRGFGFIHDGSVDNLFNFLQFPGFNFSQPATQTEDENRRDVEAFLLSYDTGIAPAVGAQVTFTGANNASPAAVARMDTLEGQHAVGWCDLIAKGRVAGAPRGWTYQGGGQWKPDVAAEPLLASGGLRALGGPGSEVTVMGVPKGSGERMGIDRDRDTFLDGDERLVGSDPGNPASTPANVGIVGPGGGGDALVAVTPNPFGARAEVVFRLGRPGPVDVRVHDLLGREVRTLARAQRFGAGTTRIAWDGRGNDGALAGAGVYFVRLRTDGGGWSRTVVRLR